MVSISAAPHGRGLVSRHGSVAALAARSARHSGDTPTSESPMKNADKADWADEEALLRRAADTARKELP